MKTIFQIFWFLASIFLAVIMTILLIVVALLAYCSFSSAQMNHVQSLRSPDQYPPATSRPQQQQATGNPVGHADSGVIA